VVTLLVLEDDDGIRAALGLAMEDEGYDVVEAASAESALVQVGRTPPDLMLVDLTLGGMDGLAFIREVRPFSRAPIIVVSARSGTDDIIGALEAGADDYVTKPFQVAEIGARLRAMRRRASDSGGGSDDAGDGADALVVLSSDGPLVLDVGAGVVRRRGEEVRLTITEFRLLVELASPPGRVLSRRSLLERVWDRDYFGDERIVDVHVRRLRTKVERDPAAPVLVVTVRGQGYRLDAG